MEDLLIHTSDKKVDILMPHDVGDGDRPCICFSLNQFISFFGAFVYLFNKKILERNFDVKRTSSFGVGTLTKVRTSGKTYRYVSQDLGYEFRIYEPIDVQHYGIGVITNFNHLKGTLEVRLNDLIISKERINLDL